MLLLQNLVKARFTVFRWQDPDGGGPPAPRALAVRKNLRSASGRTTVPMSRPSMTPPARLASVRCSGTRASRTAGRADTAEAISEHFRGSDFRTHVVAVDEDSLCRRYRPRRRWCAHSSVPAPAPPRRVKRRFPALRAAPAALPSCTWRRYRYRADPDRRASRAATVDFPAPAGPSMAIKSFRDDSGGLRFGHRSASFLGSREAALYKVPYPRPMKFDQSEILRDESRVCAIATCRRRCGWPSATPTPTS